MAWPLIDLPLWWNRMRTVFTSLYDQATKVKKLISGFIRYLRRWPWAMDLGLTKGGGNGKPDEL